MIKISGDLGLLRVGYQQAVIIDRWSLTCKHDTIGLPVSHITAIVKSVDEYWVNQEPKVLGLFMGSSWWVWTVVRADTAIYKGATFELIVEGNPVAQPQF